jgi:hypothetical protein
MAREQVTAELRPNEIQDLADQLGDLTKAAAGHELELVGSVQVGTDKAPPDDVVEQMNKILVGIEKGMRLEIAKLSVAHAM